MSDIEIKINNLDVKDIIKQVVDLKMNEQQKMLLLKSLIDIQYDMDVYTKMYTFVIEESMFYECQDYAKKELECTILDLKYKVLSMLESACLKLVNNKIEEIDIFKD